MQLPPMDISDLIYLIAGTVFGYIVKREKRILRLESLVREIKKDVKGIALVIGTPRAKAEQAALEKKLKAKELGVDSEQDDLDPLSIPEHSRQGSTIKLPEASMKVTVINIFKSLWAIHKKKVLAVVMGLIFTALAALSGLSLDEVKEAAHDASKPAVSQPAPASIPALEEK